MPKKPPARNFLNFNKSERRAIHILVGIIIGLIIAGTLFTLQHPTPNHTPKTLPNYTTFFDSLNQQPTPHTNTHYTTTPPTPQTFPFDPNTADTTQLLRLGLSSWMVNNIIKYRAKGGQYHRPEDFAKTYGLTKGDWERLKPYIRIADKYKYLADLPPIKTDTTKKHPYKLTNGQQIDLNTADTTLLQKVPGIGPYRARQIIHYRTQLGHFTSVNQLSEIENLPDTVASFFYLTPQDNRPIHINLMSINQLRRHPYINFYQARVIVEHRRKYGPLHNLSTLSLYDEFTPDDILRLTPYVSFDTDSVASDTIMKN